MTVGQRDEAIARCLRERREILERPDIGAGEVEAWLVTLGLEDWEMEMRLIEAEFGGAKKAAAA